MAKNTSSATQNQKHPLLCDEKSLVSGGIHYLGVLLSLWGCLLLTQKALLLGGGFRLLFSVTAYGASMLLLYGASGTYHIFFCSEKTHRLLRKLDHSMIYLLVAGTYTPICLITLQGTAVGLPLFIAVWALALLGIAVKLFWIDAPRWLTTGSYIAIGWLAVFAISTLVHTMAPAGIVLLLGGGVIYTAGGICYGLKVPRFSCRFFGAHEFFHILILLGSILHFFMVHLYVL